MENSAEPEQKTNTATEPAAAPTSTEKTKKSPKKLALILGLAILLLGGGAFAYTGVYKQQPSVLWADAMNNTAKGLQQLDNYDKLSQEGGKVSGSLSLETPVAITGSFEGKSKGNNAEMSGTVSASGAKVDFSLVALKAENSDYPDVYAKVSGLNSVGAFTGPEVSAQLVQFENKWFYVDHTLLGQAANSAAQKADSDRSVNPSFTEEDIQKIRENYTQVLSDYVFTADESKAIAIPTGDTVKEDFDGHASVKYNVQLNKDNLKSFATAMKDATKGTKLETMLASDGKSLEEALNFDELLSEIDKIDTSKATAEVWVDKGTRLVRNVRISPQVDSGNASVDIGLDYNGGDDLPFYIRINGDDKEAKGGVNVGITLNKSTTKVVFSVDMDMDYTDSSSQDVKGNFKLSFEPSSEDVNPSKPDGATNIMDVFGGLGRELQSFEDSSNLDSSDLPTLTDDFEL